MILHNLFLLIFATISPAVINLVPDPVGFLVSNQIPLDVFRPPSEAFMRLSGGGESGVDDGVAGDVLSDGASDNDVLYYYTFDDWLLTARPGIFGTVSGWANPTGVVLVFIFLIMFICSMKWVRKGGYFEVSTLERRSQVKAFKINSSNYSSSRYSTGHTCSTSSTGWC